MGDRANVLVRQDKDDSGVYLYTHGAGTELPATLQKALAKGWRWGDAPYLTRIIFDTMTKRCHGEELGYGISTWISDGASRILEVNCDAGTVKRTEKQWTFEEYVALSPAKIGEVW